MGEKLHLVVDLDHTLLHSFIMQRREGGGGGTGTPHRPPVLATRNDPGHGLFRLDSCSVTTKLRPFSRQFLQRLSAMYHLHVFAMGNKSYALAMIRLLDPSCLPFSPMRNVFCRSDYKKQGIKTLNVMHVHGGDHTNIVVIHDTKDIWRNYPHNLIHVSKYEFYGFPVADSSVGSSIVVAKSKQFKEEDDRYLVKIFDVLKRIHTEFFNRSNNCIGRDMRDVIKKICRETLSDCRIVISKSVFPSEELLQEAAKELKRMEVEWLSSLALSVTHVVANEVDSEEVVWAKANGKATVKTNWLKDA